MFYLQLLVPASLIFLVFAIGHLYVDVDYSGVYFKEALEEVLEAEAGDDVASGEDTSEQLDGADFPLLADKYNYLKIEKVFQGRLLDTQELFSLEVAVATYQTNVTADFFIKGIGEIEADLIAKISTIVVDMRSDELTTVEGRKIITDKIMTGLNDYLVEEGYNPDIHYVYIINYNVV